MMIKLLRRLYSKVKGFIFAYKSSIAIAIVDQLSPVDIIWKRFMIAHYDQKTDRSRHHNVESLKKKCEHEKLIILIKLLLNYRIIFDES